MSDFVDRQAVLNAIIKMSSEERLTGHWLKLSKPCAYVCFNCDSNVSEWMAEAYNYCPYCGSEILGIKEVNNE